MSKRTWTITAIGLALAWLARWELKWTTPSNAELLELAKKHPAASEWHEVAT